MVEPYVDDIDRWIRLDARGNRADVNAQFSVEEDWLIQVIYKKIAFTKIQIC